MASFQAGRRSLPSDSVKSGGRDVVQYLPKCSSLTIGCSKNSSIGTTIPGNACRRIMAGPIDLRCLDRETLIRCTALLPIFRDADAVTGLCARITASRQSVTGLTPHTFLNPQRMSSPDLRYLFMLREPFPPFRPDTVTLFAEELRSRGHQIDWIFQSKEPLTKSRETSWDGGTAWVVATDRGGGLLPKLRKHLLGLWMDIGIIARARRRHYDFIQVRDRFFGAITGLVAAKLSRTRFFFWLSFPFPEMYLYRVESGESPFPWLDRLRGNFLKLVLYRVIMPASDYIFVQSDQMKADIVANGVDPDKLMPVPMGISLKRLTAWSAADHPSPGASEVIVLYLGTLVKDRKLEFLVRVHAKVVEKIPEAKLYFVGGGQCEEDEERLRSEAIRLGISDSVVFTGFLPFKTAWQYVDRATVCVSPFYPTPILNSTSPTKLVEYMAFAKPVVANDHPDQRKVIGESGAGYCVAWDESQFAEAIVKIVNDPVAAREMGRRGKEYVERHRSYEAIAESLDQVYRALCGDEGSTRKDLLRRDEQ